MNPQFSVRMPVPFESSTFMLLGRDIGVVPRTVFAVPDISSLGRSMKVKESAELRVVHLYSFDI